MTHLIVVFLAVAATVSVVRNDLLKAPYPQNLIMTLSCEDIDVSEQKLKMPVLAPKKYNNNISLGKIEKEDTLLAKATHIQKPCHNIVHFEDIIIKKEPNISITAIHVKEVGVTQNSTATIKEGDVGLNYVVIRLQSAKGGGYHYATEVWGKTV